MGSWRGKKGEPVELNSTRIEIVRAGNDLHGGVMKGILSGILAVAFVSGTSLAQAPAAAPAPVSVPKTWVDYLTLKGDVRLRYETTIRRKTPRAGTTPGIAPASGPGSARKANMKI
jgi:hypothetical protein